MAANKSKIKNKVKSKVKSKVASKINVVKNGLIGTGALTLIGGGLLAYNKLKGKSNESYTNIKKEEISKDIIDKLHKKLDNQEITIKQLEETIKNLNNSYNKSNAQIKEKFNSNFKFVADKFWDKLKISIKRDLHYLD
jgi:septal ring factor EnvC (AmiA/AmiB activator)